MLSAHWGSGIVQPSMLAERFMKMEPMAGCPFGISGKRRQNTGLSQRERALIMPLFSPIFITPSQRASIPVSPKGYFKSCFGRGEGGVDEFCEYLHITHKDEFAEGHDECDDEECYPDVI